MSTSTRADSWVGKGPSGHGESPKRRARPELGLTWTLRVRPRGGLPHQEVGRSPRRTHPTQLGEFSKDSSESERGGFEVRTARVGVLFPRPSGRAERQVTHPSTSGLDGCKRTVHEGARDSPSLVCRG